MFESVLEKECCEYAKKQNWLVRKTRYIGRTGCPDREFMRDGRCVKIEFKKPKGVPRLKQARELQRLSEKGIEAYYIDNFESFLNVLSSES